MDVSSFSTHCNSLFDKVIRDYHKTDSVDAACPDPFPGHSLDSLRYQKNWIDTVQWHLEDLIRDPSIDPQEALRIKRRIDASNQERTDLVEKLDTVFYSEFSGIPLLKGATLNTETPAWAVDRLSILSLKIYHMRIESGRTDSVKAASCREKWDILTEQRNDLSTAIDQLLTDLKSGRKFMKLYRQMKMYNDPLLNPVLYGKGT